MSTEVTTTQSRWKSYVMWAAVVSQIVVIVGLVGGWDAIGITSDTFQGVATAILEMLTLFGIINSPTNKTSL
jgi:uncharacterized membrane protein